MLPRRDRALRKMNDEELARELLDIYLINVARRTSTAISSARLTSVKVARGATSGVGSA